MEDELLNCLEELKVIRKYLVKKGKSRFKGNVIKNKISETEIIYKKSNDLIQFLTKKQGTKTDFLTNLAVLKDEIKSYYLQIIELCSEIKQNSDSESEYCEARPNTDLIMDFDIKAACSLIPVMNSNENNTKSMIDSIEMYADMLSEPGKQLLIKFVLKSRLSENAKLRMSRDYTSTNDLVRDLRNTLLTKKSFTAIHSRLQNATQGWRSIDQYGTELEKLFTNLTISQADGNPDSYSLLKPLNEKLAIKRFADGLSDSRLGTIIAARNYDSLKVAIQAAKDEERTAASTSTDESLMQFSRRGRGKSNTSNFYQGRSYSNQSRGQRGSYHQQNSRNVGKYYGNNNNFSNFGRGQYNNNYSNFNRGQFNNYRGNTFYHSRSNNRGSYNNINRGRGYQVSGENRSSYETRGSGNKQRMFYANQSDINMPVSSNSMQNTNELQFFRSET